MLRTFASLPLTIPTLPPAGAAISRGPRHILERLPDVGGTVAAWVCWSLWKEYGIEGQSLRVPLDALECDDPLAANAFCAIKANRASPGEGDGGGYLLFSDLSVLVFQRSDRQPWPKEETTQATVDILPIVFRLATPVPTKFGIVSPQIRQNRSGLSLTFAPPFDCDANDGPRALHEQISREVAAWSFWISRMPVIARPCESLPGSDWPAFFPLEIERSSNLAAFEAHVLKAVRSVMAWTPGAFHQAQVSVWSSRPLQGGVEPMQIAMNWNMTPGCPPYQVEALNAHVLSQVFSPSTPWRMDDFPAQSLMSGDPGSSHAICRELFTHIVLPPVSSHERLTLMATFFPPPPPPPLPGHPGYGTVNYMAAPSS